MKRKRKPASQLRQEAEVREVVFARAGYRCQLADVAGAGRCWGGLTVHHIWKSGQGGPFEPHNLVALCASMNVWVEDQPDRAWALGLVKRRADSLAECWDRMRAAGIVSDGLHGAPSAPSAHLT